MTKEQWLVRIKEACESSGTYRIAFDSVIETLAGIMALRDQAEHELAESGEEAVVERTSDRGAVNLAENPRLAVLRDLNRDALAYWRELLIKPIARTKVTISKGTTLDEVLRQMESEK